MKSGLWNDHKMLSLAFIGVSLKCKNC